MYGKKRFWAGNYGGVLSMPVDSGQICSSFINSARFSTPMMQFHKIQYIKIVMVVWVLRIRFGWLSPVSLIMFTGMVPKGGNDNWMRG